MLIHSPQPWDDWRGGSYAEGNREAWPAMEEAHQAGRLRSIDVSNFERQDLENLIEAYSPIAHGEMLRNTEVAAVAERYSVSVPQLCIRYALQLGTVPLPKTANPEHMRNNALVDFVISEQDMATLRDLRISDYGRSSRFPVFSGK